MFNLNENSLKEIDTYLEGVINDDTYSYRSLIEDYMIQDHLVMESGYNQDTIQTVNDFLFEEESVPLFIDDYLEEGFSFQVSSMKQKFQLTVSKIYSGSFKNIFRSPREVLDSGRDVSNFKSGVKEASKEIPKIMKQSKDPKTFGEKVYEFLVRVARRLTFTDRITNKTVEYDYDKLFKAIGLTTAVLIINTITVGFLVGVIGAMYPAYPILLVESLATLVVVIVIGPIIEEISKAISIHLKMENEYLLMFNLIETTMYIINHASRLGFMKTTLIRIFPIIMHGTTMELQKTIMETMSEKGKYSGKVINFVAVSIASLLHIAYNAGSVFIPYYLKASK